MMQTSTALAGGVVAWTIGQAPPVAGDAAPLGGGATTGADGSAGGTAPPSSPFGGGFLFLLMGLMVFMLVMSSMGQRKEKKRRAALLDSLGKHDRVQTSGGVIGTIVELRDGEVVLKVDESTNTKIRFARSAVQTVLKKSGATNESDAVAEPELASTP